MNKRIDRADIIGQTVGKLTVVSYNEGVSEKTGRHYYTCLCECGNEKAINRTSLLSGNTRSCGCLYKKSNKTNRAYKVQVKELQEYVVKLEEVLLSNGLKLPK